MLTKVKNTNRSNPEASTVFGRQRAPTNLVVVKEFMTKADLDP